MFVLGLHQGHDSSTTLVKDGEIIASACEERFTGIKHYAGVPYRSLNFCLQKAGITIKDVDSIVFPSLGQYRELEILLSLKKSTIYKREFPEMEKKPADYVRFFLIKILRKLSLVIALQTPSYLPKFPFPSPQNVFHIDHHLAHAASAYYNCGFQEKTLVITADGSGDGLSNTVWIGENGILTPKLKLERGSSLGAFYGLITEALGWWIGDGEGKTMGLAPYGTTKKTKGVLDEFLPRFRDGYLQRGYNWGFGGIWEDKGAYHFSFKDTKKVQKLIQKYGRENIAAEAQRCLEEQLLNFVIPWIKREKVKYLAAAGGVFLNVKANQKIWETGLLKDFFIFPDAGDGGLSTGAALQGYFSRFPKKYKSTKQISNLYWGPAYATDEIENLLKVRKINYQKLKTGEMTKKIAGLLSENKIVALFNGGMEVGPRALGNRSILMSPLKPENKDIINSTVKYRESFRPFCPSLIDKAADKYLVNPSPNPAFMVISSDVPKNEYKNIPAVVHVDGTARPQVVKRQVNSFYYDLILEFGKITGIPVLLNTSFNIKNEPIVCTPSDALKCFYDTGIDYLVFEKEILLLK